MKAAGNIPAVFCFLVFFILTKSCKNSMICMKSITSMKCWNLRSEYTMADQKGGFPEGRFMGTVKVGEKGQIVIPKTARDMFGIKPGDTLLLLADSRQGIAIVRNETFVDYTNQILNTSPLGKHDEEEK